MSRMHIENGPDRKALQLAAQVKEALSWVLGSSADAVLTDCQIAEVQPLPAGRILVTVFAPPDIPIAKVFERLDAASGWLRTEIAQAITRRKTPELVFHVLQSR